MTFIEFKVDTGDVMDKLTTLTSQERIQIMDGIGYIIENSIVQQVNRMGLVDTGAFRSSIMHVADADSTIVYSDIEYAPHLEYGTRPHKIKPSSKKALYWEGADHPVKMVNHPGTREYAPFRKGLLDSTEAVVKHVKDKIIEFAK